MTRRLHASIDIESFDTTPTAVIASIGAVLFDEDDVHSSDAFYKRVSWQEQLGGQWPRTVSESTLRWWFAQSDDARRELTAPADADLSGALQALNQWASGKPIVAWWARGTQFDIAAIEHAYRQIGLRCPWKYNGPRDQRTFCDDILLPSELPLFLGTPHHPVDDAAYQAMCQQTAWRKLRMMADAFGGPVDLPCLAVAS